MEIATLYICELIKRKCVLGPWPRVAPMKSLLIAAVLKAEAKGGTDMLSDLLIPAARIRNTSGSWCGLRRKFL